jgi:SPP1 family phage portal protein
MFNFVKSKLEQILTINRPALSDEEFIVNEIEKFMRSDKRRMMIDGKRYYAGDHDILKRKRTAIGKGGEVIELHNLPNNRVVDNQYRKMVVQKSNYLVGKPVTVQGDNEEYVDILKGYFDKRFMRLLNLVANDSLNCGIGYLHPCYDDKGEFTFKRFNPEEIRVGWKDADHTQVDYFIRFYDVLAYVGNEEKTIRKVEVYDESGISFFELDDSHLKAVEPFHQTYFTANDTGYNWTRVPLIPWKYNAEEIPLIKVCKSLQDGINVIVSNFQNNMEEDARSTIMVLVNYDGQDLGEFRQNLATYSAVKVRSTDGVSGDVKTLQVEVNADNYESILKIFKDKLIENAMGYDAKDERMNGTPNQMNIQSMYSDIDLDANAMETEYQASFDDLLWFIDCHLANTGVGDFENEIVSIVFNRDMLMNESEKIQNLQNSMGLISDETIIANHPWVDDVEAELDKLKQQKQEQMMEYDPFKPQVGDDE